MIRNLEQEFLAADILKGGFFRNQNAQQIQITNNE
jgi:hypothetical protein